MKIYPLNTGYFKLDGGAMFGVVPKSIWNKTNPSDENNLCNWALRCMLIEDGKRLILVDNGVGDKQEEKFFKHYYLSGEHNLEKSLNKLGFTSSDVSDVFLTHLHFDHCGGSIKYNSDRTKLSPAFKNATYWSNAQHWKCATEPNPREKASFLKDNILPIAESGQLKFVEREGVLFDHFSVLFFNGHTEAMMLPVVDYKGKKVVFMADLLPSVGHIPLPYVMAYDTRPLVTMDEKAKFLKDAVEQEYVLFFEHDPVNECCTLQETDRGIRLKETFEFTSFFGQV